MAKYMCSVCGYIYDEEEGIPDAGIAPGTTWENLPSDWSCPLCGASKADFEKEGEPAVSLEKKSSAAIESPMDVNEPSPLAISALCTNLARGCEKQYKPEEEALFNQLAEYFKSLSAAAKEPAFDQIIAMIEKDLEEGFPSASSVSSDVKDRGALRALVWSEKVTRILNSLLARYQKEGEAMLENTDVHVCTICGFVYIGDDLPGICPVCKVPNWKFEKVEGR
jgi:rubredoxin